MRDLLVNIELVYFIYVRKSTDVEDKQILSVAAQIIELKEFAKRMGLRIAGIIVEKQTAKKPGRPKFNKMLERIENGEANGVLAWLPDRLSRNSIDSGRVIYMLDENIIADLKFPHFWFENTRLHSLEAPKSLESAIAKCRRRRICCLMLLIPRLLGCLWWRTKCFPSLRCALSKRGKGKLEL